VRQLSDEDQVNALATNTEWSLAFAIFHSVRPTREQISSLFTITPLDIQRLVQRDESWLNHVHRQPDILDGAYVVALPGGEYETYRQERGAKFGRQTWKTLEGASTVWVDLLVRRLVSTRAGTAR